MKITGTAIKLGAFSLVLLLFTAIIIVVFGQFRFDRTNGYTAEFSNASGLRAGQFVRASGVEVGKVSKVELVDGGQRVQVDFNVDRSLPLYQSTTAQIRYQDLIGNRYLELAARRRRGRRPHAAAGRLHPAVAHPARAGPRRADRRVQAAVPGAGPGQGQQHRASIITVFQGQGGTINDILDQTAQLTSALADRDQAIGEVITNLNTVLATTVKHQKEFDQTVNNFEVLITGLKNRADPLADATANISNAAGTLGDLLADNRPLLKDTIAQPRDHRSSRWWTSRPELDDLLTKLPQLAQDHRPRRRYLRRLLQLLSVRPDAEAQRLAAGWAGPHGEGVHAAHG